MNRLTKRKHMNRDQYMAPTILLVDDEDFFRERLGRAFKKRGCTVFLAADYNEAMRTIKESRPEMAVVDLKMPGKSGLELIKDALALHPEMRIVVLTGYGSIATATKAVKSGALSYLPKPTDVDDIFKALTQTTSPDLSARPDDFQTPSLARIEWEHITRVLYDCRGNISAAAKILGLHRRTLQRKLDKFPPDS